MSNLKTFHVDARLVGGKKVEVKARNAHEAIVQYLKAKYTRKLNKKSKN